MFTGAAWQRCRVHFLGNILTRVPRGNAEMVAAAIRTIFSQPDAEHVHSQLDMIAGMLGRQFPAVETMLIEAKDDLLAFTSFPVAHWKKIWSTNPLERVNKEIKTPHRRRRRLPQPAGPAPPRRRGPGRDPRRMGRHRPPLPRRRIHENHHHHDQGGSAHHHADGIGNSKDPRAGYFHHAWGLTPTGDTRRWRSGLNSGLPLDARQRGIYLRWNLPPSRPARCALRSGVVGRPADVTAGINGRVRGGLGTASAGRRVRRGDSVISPARSLTRAPHVASASSRPVR